MGTVDCKVHFREIKHSSSEYEDEFLVNCSACEFGDACDYLYRILTSKRWWIRVLYRVRDAMMKPFGITDYSNDEVLLNKLFSGEKEVRKRDFPDSSMHLLCNGKEEARLIMKNKHLDFMLQIRIVDRRNEVIELKSYYLLHDCIGRIYFNLIKLPHCKLVPVMIRSLSKESLSGYR